jgi:hypothetical protein
MLLLYAIVISALSAARELSVEKPIERRIAALRNKSVIQNVFFILSSRGSIA